MSLFHKIKPYILPFSFSFIGAGISVNDIYKRQQEFTYYKPINSYIDVLSSFYLGAYIGGGTGLLANVIISFPFISAFYISTTLLVTGGMVFYHERKTPVLSSK